MSFIGHNHSASLNIVNSALRNPLFGGPLFNSDMETAAENRLKRLLALRDRYVSIAALARALHRSPRDATLSQIITRAPDSKTGKPRQMGSILAKQIEKALSLPIGWMDQSGPASLPPGITTHEPDGPLYHDPEATLVAGFRAAPPAIRQAMLALAQSAIESASPLDKPKAA